ncbi:hypothetical protein HZB00_01275 [Candidatus Woesearchaeota archaeon]|nr:hypothetical protein [Candidatus Woesearchaeota archaeon]
MLTYKFAREEIGKGRYTYRPKALIEIEGNQFFPIVDSGCDTTVISEGFADAFGIKKGEKTELKAFREGFEVYQGKFNIRFLGKEQRLDEVLTDIPCLIVPKEKEYDEDADLVLGIAGIFDKSKISFNLNKGKFTMQRILN